jgi:hypothetical protein
MCNFKFILLAIAATAFAEEYRGTILGRISDPSGAAIVGALPGRRW